MGIGDSVSRGESQETNKDLQIYSVATALRILPLKLLQLSGTMVLLGTGSQTLKQKEATALKGTSVPGKRDLEEHLISL